MQLRLGAVIAAAAFASVLAPAVPALAADRGPVAASNEPGFEYASDRAIVGVTPGERSDARSTIEDGGGDVVDYNPSGGFFVVETSVDSAQWADAVEGDGSVRYAEPDWALSAADLTPSDPLWGQLWGLRKIQAPAAWETTGSSDVIVGVIDSGVDYTHEDLASHMWINPNEDPSTPADDDNNGWKNDIHGIDCANDDADPADDNGHGTHVAGTIGAASDNSTGVTGTARNVKIMALKFLGADGTGYTSDAIECLYYAIENGAHVTNNSWGGPSYSKTLHEAIRYASFKDQLFVAAAGNDGVDIDATPHYPASYDADNVIAVAATDRSDNLAVFSNHGAASVDLAAPGVGIVSTVPGGYASYSGTSMAAPHVTGAAAMLLGADGSFRSDAGRLRAALLDNADPIAGLAGKIATGSRLNLARAVWPDRPTSMHVHGTSATTRRVSKSHRKVTIAVVIATDRDALLEGAKVVVAWSARATSSCFTGTDGTCSVSKKMSFRAARHLRATVASASHARLAHDVAADHAG